MKFNSELLEITNSDMPSFSLFEGGYISKFTLAYETYGDLNSNKDNAILLFHALTGSQHAAGTNTDGPGTIDGDNIVRVNADDRVNIDCDKVGINMGGTTFVHNEGRILLAHFWILFREILLSQVYRV